MVFEIDILGSAYEDLDEAVNYYESQSKGLGFKFHEDFLNQAEKLKVNPQFFRNYVEDFRRILFDKFPYLVIFKIIENRIVIFAITYGGKDPEAIFKKIH